MHDLKTQNDFRYDEVSSALQKSVRRCLWPESLQWFLEAFRCRGQHVSPHQATATQTNILRRLFIYASEDIGPANPSLILLLDDILDVDNPQNQYLQEIIPIMILHVMTLSPKSRMFDWIADVLTHQTYDFDGNMPLNSMLDTITYHLLHLEDALGEKDFPRACEWLGRYYYFFSDERSARSSDTKILKTDFDKLKSKFNAPPVVKHFAKPSELFWLPVLGIAVKQGMSQEVATLVCRLHHIACRRSGTFSFRYVHGVILFWIHAVWALCNPDEIKRTWSGDQCHSQIREVMDYPEVLKLCSSYSERSRDEVVVDGKKLYPMPDYALDKHTAAGSKMGRDISHFISEGSKLTYMVPELLTEDKYWLNRMIEF